MSMSTNVIGIKLPDATWSQMKTVYDACKTAGVGVPEQVLEYFDYQKPDKCGVITDIPFTEYKNGSSFGFEINVKEIPEGVSLIRFTNSY